jgi:hypothetical protein
MSLSLGTWQDDVIAVIQWIFVFALVPTVLHPTEKPVFTSAVITSTSLFVMAATLETLHLCIGALSTAAGGAVWTVLAYQRFRINREKGEPVFKIKWPF